MIRVKALFQLCAARVDSRAVQIDDFYLLLAVFQILTNEP